MLVTVDGIVIGRRSIGENSCFIDVLTDEYGVIEATAHERRCSYSVFVLKILLQQNRCQVHS